MRDWLEHGEAYTAEMIASARALSESLTDHDVDVQFAGGGHTQSHQLAIRPDDIDADTAVARLRTANLLTCAIGLPDTAGVRVGTPEAVRWGMTAADMSTLAGFIADGLAGRPGVGEAVTEWRAPFDTVGFCS